MAEQKPVIRIVIADDHPLLRDGLRRLFELQPGLSVVGEAADGVEALERVRELKPDILLLDVGMPRMNGLEVLRVLAGEGSDVRTVLLTASIESEETVQALRLGARGVVLKESATEQLYKCIHAVMRGDFWIGHERVGDLLQTLFRAEREALTQQTPASTLTPRERQVIAAIAEGASNKDIGRAYGLSEQTVKNHLSNIFDKLGVSTRLELALYAVHHRLTADGSPARAGRKDPAGRKSS
jgi:DNA-binding NarL/FixJ family response regulator